jgi:hypothetical protein
VKRTGGRKIIEAKKVNKKGVSRMGDEMETDNKGEKRDRLSE